MSVNMSSGAACGQTRCASNKFAGNPLTRKNLFERFQQSDQSDLSTGQSPKKGGVGAGCSKALKWGLLSNLVTIPLSILQVPLIFTAGIGCITILKTLLLGPLIASGIGFAKGLLGK